MKTRFHFVPIAAAMLGMAVPAQAAIVYSNNFDGENGGTSAKDYTGFAGLTVSYPSVDLLHTGDGSGVTCAGTAGGCVDLDGGLSGQIVSTKSYGFSAGDKVTLSFAISGSQRASSPLDTTLFGFRFDQPTTGSFVFASTSGKYLADYFDPDENYFLPGTYDLTLFATAEYDYGLFDVNFSFVADNAGSVRFLFDQYNPFYDPDPADVHDPGDPFYAQYSIPNDDDAGRVIDNVALDISPVPEPSTWATTILGLGLAGAVARRRPRRAAAA